MISGEWRRTIAQAVILGVVCALLVWFLEDFNRRKLVEEWTGFIERWETPRGGHNGTA